MAASVENMLEYPSWINREFIESALRNKHGKIVVADSLAVQRLNIVGTGYTSHMFRVSVPIRNEDGSTQSLSIIVKVALPSGAIMELVASCQAYRNESVMLHEVMPQLCESLRAVEGGGFEPLSAHCFRWGADPSEFLVLEDLSAQGFRMAARGRPLDLQHCTVVLRAYARLHAASALLLKKLPHYRDTFSVSFLTEPSMQDFSRSLNSKIFRQLGKELEITPGYEQYSRKYLKLAERCLNDPELFSAYMKVKSKLPVLIHGDCWKNNFMFKYVDEEVKGVRLLDFQGTTVGGPAPDLVYFLFANASEEVHRHHLDRLLEEYHATLTHLLHRLGMEEEAEAYTLQQLRQEMDAAPMAGVAFSAISAFVLTSEALGEEFQKMFNDPEQSDEALQKAFKNPYSMSYLKYLVPIFDRKGLFID